MSSKYLVRVSLAMIVVSIVGLAVFYTMRAGLPATPGWDWPERDAAGQPVGEAAQREAVAALRARATGTARFLAGAEAVARFERAGQEAARREASESTTSATAGTDRVDFDDKYSTRSLFESARWHAFAVIVMFYVTLACGLLGLLRLRVRGMVVLGGSVMVLAILGGGALLIFTGAATLAGMMLAIMLFGFFGQLVASNLLPGADHPFVVHAEDELRALPAARRKAHVAKRLIGGLLLTIFGGAFTALSLAIHAGVVVIATGAIAGGLMMMATPLIASVRLRMRR